MPRVFLANEHTKAQDLLGSPREDAFTALNAGSRLNACISSDAFERGRLGYESDRSLATKLTALALDR